jgi:hypothetical protein
MEYLSDESVAALKSFVLAKTLEFQGILPQLSRKSCRAYTFIHSYLPWSPFHAQVYC